MKPDFWNDQGRARAVINQANAQRAVLKPFGELSESLDEAQLLMELAETEDDEVQRKVAFADVQVMLVRAEKLFDKLELQSLLSGELDGNSAYVTIHAGAGGTESCDWADMLLRLYRRYCERVSFDVEIMDVQQGEEAGIRSVTFGVSGAYAYGHLKSERGVHRLVRISPFDANKRRHTSFASLDVVAELAEDLDVEIDEKDLRIDTFRSSGAGGQHVNTTDSAVRITHLPTGIVVGCQAERSQHKNKAKAMSVLKARVYEWTRDQKRQEMDRFYGDKGEIAWGSQIRSYVLHPYQMVKDVRSNTETSNTAAVLDGDLDMFIEAYLRLKKQDASG